DIVHARSRVPAWIAYFACRKTKTFFVTTCHGYYKKHPFSYVMGWGKRVIAISNVVAWHMIDDFGVSRERVRLVARSVDLEKFKYTLFKPKNKTEEFHVAIIGRLTPIKGHLYFIKAMAKLSRSIPKLKIWIVGDAPLSKEAYKEQVRVLVRRLDLWHCTEFLGAQRDIPAIMRNLDVLVLATTTHEAFGRVIIEAQASGVPVVATSVGGVIDIIEDKVNGLLVPPADSQAIADAVLKLYENQDFAAKLSVKAYEKVKEKFNLGLMVENTLAVYRDVLESVKILVLKFSSLGDVILSTSSIRALRSKFPKYKISLLIGEESKQVFLRCPYIDELLVCDFKNKERGWVGLWNFSRSLRNRNFDLSVDLQNNRKSHLLSRLSLAFDRYGYDNKKFGFLLNHRIRDKKPAIDPLTHQASILKMLDIEKLDARLEMWPSKEDQDYIDDFLNQQWTSQAQKMVGINISASLRWTTKLWPLKYVVKLCEELASRDMRVVITGTATDLERANFVLNSARTVKPINACGRTSINQLYCLIKKCSLYISTDSAPLHVATAAKVACIGLFGPTDPRRHMVPKDDSIVIRKDLSCSPCYKPNCKKKDCMELITPSQVLEAIDRLIK
ncbi:MAG: GT4 family glycosyltransferase PelF, partial [Candidatus Omnitrophica bacterium]|nr:GT4 family glycosyltransferase PelF [Candidatus Omnitrophota bacterium]